ncbi:MAG: hypothetical protein VKK42_09275 [Lyngbya sp.]|nr:hypothetical protein [Lyngbya sp.]
MEGGGLLPSFFLINQESSATRATCHIFSNLEVFKVSILIAAKIDELISDVTRNTTMAKAIREFNEFINSSDHQTVDFSKPYCDADERLTPEERCQQRYHRLRKEYIK